MEGKNFAREAQRAHIELSMRSAEFRRHHGCKKSGFSQSLHTRAASGIDIVMRQLGKRGFREA
jgi:hypothetical protein